MGAGHADGDGNLSITGNPSPPYRTSVILCARVSPSSAILCCLYPSGGQRCAVVRDDGHLSFVLSAAVVERVLRIQRLTSRTSCRASSTVSWIYPVSLVSSPIPWDICSIDLLPQVSRRSWGPTNSVRSIAAFATPVCSIVPISLLIIPPSVVLLRIASTQQNQPVIPSRCGRSYTGECDL